MRYDVKTKQQAEGLYELFTTLFGKTTAFRQAQTYICKLLTGNHPALPGRVLTRGELEESIRKAVGQNKHDARNFFGPDALFNQYLTGESIQQEVTGLTEKQYHATSQIINLYLREVNPRCKAGESEKVRLFLTYLMTDPRILGYQRRLTKTKIIRAVKRYGLEKLTVDIQYRHHLINFFVNKRVFEIYLE